MTTLLQFVSDVLIKIGEETVDTVNRSPASRLAAANTITAIRALADEFSYWPWMHSEYTAQSWVQNVATLPDGILNVSFVQDNGSRTILEYLDERAFYKLEPIPYTGTNGGAKWYTIRSGKYLFTPYPNDADSRNNIVFNAAVLPNLSAAADSEVIPVAERDLNTLLFRVCMMMSIDHLQDSQLAQVYGLEYNRALTAAKQRMITNLADNRRSMIW